MAHEILEAIREIPRLGAGPVRLAWHLLCCPPSSTAEPLHSLCPRACTPDCAGRGWLFSCELCSRSSSSIDSNWRSPQPRLNCENMKREGALSIQRQSQLRHALSLGLATAFAAVTILYSALWMYAVRRPSASVELGFNKTRSVQYKGKIHGIPVLDVVPGSPAERAGLRPDDLIVGINGQTLQTSAPLDETWARSRPGDQVEVTVERPGEPELLTLRGTFRAAQPQSSEGGLARESAQQMTGSFPVLLLVVGLAVLFLRVDDPNAWLLALVFAGFIGVPGPTSFAALTPALQIFARGYRAIFLGLSSALFYLFFAVFPARSPLDRRVPWLKWIAFVLGLFVALPGLRVGDVRAPAMLASLVGEQAAARGVLGYIYLFFALGRLGWAGTGGCAGRGGFGKGGSIVVGLRVAPRRAAAG